MGNDDKDPEAESDLLYDLVKDTGLLSKVVMIGASALVPVPFLDDVAKAYLEKSLFASIAQRSGVALSKEEKQKLTQDSQKKGCFAWGCLGSVFLYPFKKLLRKVFFFLEIKRSVDQSTTALAEAYLFKLALKQGLWKPGGDPKDAEAVRRAIRATCQSQGVKPLEASIRHAFEGTKGIFAAFAATFMKEKPGADEVQIERAVASLEKQETAELAGLTQKLSSSLENVSESYLERFNASFESCLKAERLTLSESSV